MTHERLFKDRTPEAAALQLATVLAWLTECELETLERLRRLKSTAKYELRRHETICNDAVRHCAELQISPRGLHGMPCSRLTEALGETKK